MADPSAVVEKATSVPSPEDVSRAEKFTRERFVHPGEEPADALARGTGRRHALDDALAELDSGAKVPSTQWRRHYALLLGLERVLSDDEPRLADGTLLNPHQVDALSGTLTALLAAAQVTTNGNSNGAKPTASPVLAVDDEHDDDEEEEEQPDYDPESQEDLDEDIATDAADDPNAAKRFWFEHATGAGKSVAALGFVEASRTGGVLILTHRRNLVEQFEGELKDRGYAKRISKALLGDEDRADGPVTVETYQWFVRNAGQISSAYTIVICDEAHTALGEKTSAAIRQWTGPIFIGMTATGALIARHVTDLFPTQTSRFDLAQAARRGVISPLRDIRIPPGPGVRTIAKVPLRRGDVDVEFDQEMLAELLDQLPFNLAIANLYKTRFNGVPGVVYAAGVRHAMNVAQAFRDEGMKAEGVSGETPKRQLAEILAAYERGDIDVLVNAQLLAEGWNSPRATVCMHLAPTASRRIYQQRVGRVTRRHPGKESGIVVDFVHPATKHDDPVITLHSLLDRDVYRGGAIVVGPVRRGRGRRVRVERRVIPVVADEARRIEVFERELWRIAVEHLDYGEQIQWAALAGARVNPSGWRRARAMLHFDKGGELKRAFLLTAIQRNKHSALRVRALQDIVAAKDAEAIDLAIDEIGKWSRDEKREASKVMLQALAEKQIGRRDQANAWIWRLAFYTRDIHEEYAVARWPETKRLLGLLVNSSGAAHARNARRLIQATRKQDRRLSAAILAAALAHTPEAEEALRGARTRMARKPNALARDLLRNFPKGRRGRNRRRKKKGAEGDAPQVEGALDVGDELDDDDDVTATPMPARRKRRRSGGGAKASAPAELDEEAAAAAIREAAALLGGATPDDEVEGPLFDRDDDGPSASGTGDAWARDENAVDDEFDSDAAGIDEDEVEDFVGESEGLDLDDDGEPDLPDSEEVVSPDPDDVPVEAAHISFEIGDDEHEPAPKPAARRRAPAKKPAAAKKPATAKKPAAAKKPATAKKAAAAKKPAVRKKPAAKKAATDESA
jgi:ribonuclease E